MGRQIRLHSMSDDREEPPRKPGHRETGEGEQAPREAHSDVFDLEGSDPELLHSGRIPDPLPDHTPLFRWMARVLSAAESRLRARGGRSFRAMLRVLWAFVAGVGLFLLVGPVINAPLDIDDVLASAHFEDVDWIARDVALDYAIDRAEHGEFTADVTESFTTFFVNDQSASEITRAVVTEFQGHDVDFDLHGATIDGEAAKTRITRNPTMTTIHISRADGSRLSGHDHRVELSYDLQNLVTTEADEATGRNVDQWSWPLFAAWPQATSGIEASFTFSTEVNDAMIRAPRAYVGWLLVSGTQRLTPEETTATSVRYAFTNDDNLPPNADFWIHASFEPGTFAQPPTTPLFWVQTWGPLLPLAVLVIMLLFGLAARRIVWADSAGRPWYVARSEPPSGLTPEDAAQLMRKPWHAELIAVLSRSGMHARSRGPRRSLRKRGKVTVPEVATGHARETWLAQIARVGRRAGRLGTLPAVIGQRNSWAVQRPDRMVDQGLRWVPDSYLRDSFIFAPLAVALLQWGILRQLSHQVILTVLWFPFAIVALSTALALLTAWSVSKPRPLTPAGALVMQDLKGIHAYARSTRLTERGPLDESILPYAMLFEPARRAGDLATEQAIAETGDRGLTRGWRTSKYISGPAFLAAAAAVALFAGVVVAVSAIAPPYAMEKDYATDFASELRGLNYTQTRGFDVEAELGRAADGSARLDVTERLQVEFDGQASRVPQFAREWPASRLGQDLGLTDIALTIDGEPVETVTRDNPAMSTRYIFTQLEEVLDGVHDVEVTYALTHPVVSVDSGAETFDQLRWTAFLSFWEDTYYTTMSRPFDGSVPVRPLKLQFTLDAELLSAVKHGGWIDYDHERPRVRGESGNWYAPWDYGNSTYLGERGSTQRYEFRIGRLYTRDDGALVATIDADAVQSRQKDTISGDDPGTPWVVDEGINEELMSFELRLGGDLGVRIDFAPGTFSGVDAEISRTYQFMQVLPYILLLALGGLVIIVSVVSTGYAASLRSRGRRGSSSFALIAFLAIPLAAVAQCIMFFWVIGPGAGDSPMIPGALAVGGFMLLAVIVEMGMAGSTMGEVTKRTAARSSA